jgi:hypothetical protein
MRTVSGVMLALFLVGFLAFSFNVQAVDAEGSWVWVRDTVTGAYGEAVVGTGTALYIARGTRFYRYTPSDNRLVELAPPPKPDGDAFKTGTALAWDFGDCIYALFGAATGDSRRWFYRYRISTNSWEALANTPADQGEGDALTWVGEPYNCLYATIGGEQRPTYLMRYIPSTNTWDDAPANPPGGMGDGASLVWTGGDSLYALRGEFLETQPLNDFWHYNLTADVWSSLAEIPAEPHDGGVGGVGDGGSLLYIGFWMANQTDYIYALSGNQAYPEPIPDNRTYRYKISTNSWERLADLPFGVGDYVGCRLGYAEGHIYAWQGTPSTWAGGGDDLAMFTFPSTPTTKNVTITISTTDGGTTDPQPGAYTFLYGSRVNVTAFPKAGYSFSYWLLDGEKRTENPISVLMDSNHTLHAVFTQITYQLSITSTTGGTTNPAPGIYTYVNGTHVVITAVPNNGYSFDYWLLDGVKTTQNPITIIMNANHTLEAHFIDNIPPEISEPWQDPPANNVQLLQNVTVWVNVTDYGTGIKNVTLWYSINNGTTWTIINMTELPIPSNTWITYKATIKGYENCTWITYKIVAYDNAGNNATKDNNGYGYKYHVIPEYPLTMMLTMLILTTSIATILLKKKGKAKPQLP